MVTTKLNQIGEAFGTDFQVMKKRPLNCYYKWTVRDKQEEQKQKHCARKQNIEAANS